MWMGRLAWPAWLPGMAMESPFVAALVQPSNDSRQDF
jgi:hypothetical protein